jgi:hypothetical protein
MRRELARDDWDEQLRGLSTEEAWSLFRNRLQRLVEKHVPPRRLRNHNRPPWLSREILREIQRKKRLWRHAKQGQKAYEYRDADRKVKRMIKNAKKSSSVILPVDAAQKRLTNGDSIPTSSSGRKADQA